MLSGKLERGAKLPITLHDHAAHELYLLSKGSEIPSL